MLEDERTKGTTTIPTLQIKTILLTLKSKHRKT